jgi:aminopeptidase-like protein
MKNEKTFLQIAIITFIATLVSHALLLINNGAMWDGLLLECFTIHWIDFTKRKYLYKFLILPNKIGFQ